MNLRPDNKLETREELVERIKSIERKRARMNDVTNPRDWRKRAEEFQSMARRLDDLRDRLKKMGKAEVPQEPAAPVGTGGTPLPRNAKGKIQWTRFLDELDLDTIVVIPSEFKGSVSASASRMHMPIEMRDLHNGTFALLRLQWGAV